MDIIREDCIYAVSYTHLDVYKRQGCRSLFHADAHRRDCISVSRFPSFAVWTASGGGLPSLGAGRRQISSVPVSGKLSSLGPYWPEVGAVWMGRPFLMEGRDDLWLPQLLSLIHI